MKKENLIGREIHCLDNMIGRLISSYRSQIEYPGGSHIQGWIIHYLYSNSDKEIFQKDIEAQFRITRSTVTGILQSMERNNLIIRKACPTDARLKRLVLTEQGIKLHDTESEIFIAVESQLKRNISDEDLETFFQVLQKVRENVETDDHYQK